MRCAPPAGTCRRARIPAGTGAIGGWLGARLAASGAAEVSAIARGRTLASLEARGWRLESGGELTTAPARVAASGTQLGSQDVVVLAVKAPALPDVVGLLPPLLGDDTVVLPFMNGVPWWFGHGTALGDEPLESVDPGGAVAAALPRTTAVLGGRRPRSAARHAEPRASSVHVHRATR